MRATSSGARARSIQVRIGLLLVVIESKVRGSGGARQKSARDGAYRNVIVIGARRGRRPGTATERTGPLVSRHTRRKRLSHERLEIVEGAADQEGLLLPFVAGVAVE